MTQRLTASVTAFAFLLAQAPLPASAQNGPRYVLLSERDVPRLNDNGGRLGLRIDNTRSVSFGNGVDVMLFRVSEILPGSAFAGSGLVPGDEIVALNGYQFRDGASYAAYVHSLPGTSRPVLDYAEHGTGRLIRLPALTMPPRGYAEAPAKPRRDSSDDAVLGALVLGAIGVGVCWLAGCFSGGSSAPSAAGGTGRSGGGGSSGGGSSYNPPATTSAAAPVWPTVQGDVHGNTATDVHGNGPRDVHGNPAMDVQGNPW